MTDPEPFGPVLHRARIIREAPPHIREQVRLSDRAANQLRHRSIEPSAAEHVWLWGGALAGAIVGFALVWGVL